VKVAWFKLADYYKRFAAASSGESASAQLARLVLAEHCIREWSGDYGGPTEEMVALAESVTGDRLDEKLAAEMAKAGA
jgi:hypothetical protein